MPCDWTKGAAARTSDASRLLGNGRPVVQFAIDAGDLDMRGHAENARAQLLLKAVHHRQHDDQRRPSPMPSIEMSEMKEMK
jgi:hypothetical protein